MNAIVGGGVLALAIGVATGASIGISAAMGGLFAILYLIRTSRWERGYHEASADRSRSSPVARPGDSLAPPTSGIVHIGQPRCTAPGEP